MTTREQKQMAYVSSQEESCLYCYGVEGSSLTLADRFPLRGGPAPLGLGPGGGTLYCGLRDEPGLAALLIDRATGQLTPGDRIALDAEPCFVGTDRGGRFLLAAYYRAGRISVHRIRDRAGIEPEPVLDRATDQCAHMFVTDPSDRYAFVPHTQPNLLLQFRYDPSAGALSANEPDRARVPPGVGPRHLCFHPDGRFVYVSNELGNSVSAYRFNPQNGTLGPLQTLSTLPADSTVASKVAQIRITPDGRYLYVSNRGHDTIASFAVDSAEGTLRALGHTVTQPFPRAIEVDRTGTLLMAAGRDSGTLSVYRIDRETGGLEQAQDLRTGPRALWVLTVALGP